MRFSSISSGRSFYAPSFFVGFCLGGSGLDWVEDYYMVFFWRAPQVWAPVRLALCRCQT